MKLKVLIFVYTVLLYQVVSPLQGQTINSPLKDSAIVLLQQLKKFSNYKIHFVLKDHPLSPQQEHIDTTKISYYCNPLNKETHFFLLRYNLFMGFAIKDSCHFYFGSAEGYTRYNVRCRPCRDVLQEDFYKPLDASKLIKIINIDSTVNISLQHKGDTIILKISGHIFQDSLNKYQVDYYFNVHDGFPIKYNELVEYYGDFQVIEYCVIDYSLKPDPLLEDFLSKLLLITDPGLVFKEIDSY